MNLSFTLICYATSMDGAGGSQPADGNKQPIGNLLDTQDILLKFKISYRTVQNWIKAGLLQPIRIRGRNYFLESDVDDMIRKMRGKAEG